MARRGMRARVTLTDAIVAGEAERWAIHESLGTYRTDLPLRYWRQQAHFTTPAANPGMALKAVEGGTAPVARVVAHLGLTPADLAERLGLPTAFVEERLTRPMRSPLVMLDGEDAIAPGQEVAARSISVTVETLGAADWGADGLRSLRFYRPPGFALENAVRDLLTLLWRLRERNPEAETLPLDGIVFPKVEHPEEVDLLNGILSHAEVALGLPVGGIRVSYLIESGWAAAQLPEIVRRAAPRLASLIFGIADFSADLGLPIIGTSHPLADWARAEIVAVAGGVGVPAIDAMTLDFPVADPSLTAIANRERWLERMRLVYDDAARARDLGMLGKWVGHPAQLFAVLCAYDHGLTDESLDARQPSSSRTARR